MSTHDDDIIELAELAGAIIDAKTDGTVAMERAKRSALSAILMDAAERQRTANGLGYAGENSTTPFTAASAQLHALLGEGDNGRDGLVGTLHDAIDHELYRRDNPDHGEWSKPRERPEGNARDWLDKRIADDEATE